jgi:hypothetical protein
MDVFFANIVPDLLMSILGRSSIRTKPELQ